MKLVKYDSGTALYQESLVLRNRMLRLPIGKDIFTEDLQIETNNDFYGILVEKKLIATFSIYNEAPFIAHLTAFAVDAPYQKMSYGSQLLAFLINDLEESYYKRINVDARVSAIEFYQKCRFGLVKGPIYHTHLGIDEYKMSDVF